MKGRIKIELTERAKGLIAKHAVRAEEIISLFEQDFFVKREGKRFDRENKRRSIFSSVLGIRDLC